MLVTASSDRAIVEEFWRRLGAFDFDGAGDLLHEAYICEWPQSRERIRGRANFVALNAAYPGRWATTIRRIVESGGQVATEVELTNLLAPGEAPVVAISFFELQGGAIRYERDYWPEPYAAPADRARWVEPMEPAS
jgi:limonene-1,2-epoxide hydrolase